MKKKLSAGAVYSRMTVLSREETGERGHSRYLCRCECGTEIVVRGTSLTSGNTTSCGCYHLERLRMDKLKHGDKPKAKAAPEYTAWTNMITRCTNPKHNRWQHYGGRGIAICDRWRNSYEAFLADVGRRPSPAHSIDRYPDCDGDYEPGNVRWATGTEQRLNQRRQKAA